MKNVVKTKRFDYGFYVKVEGFIDANDIEDAINKIDNVLRKPPYNSKLRDCKSLEMEDENGDWYNSNGEKIGDKTGLF